jgi:hypothetical protein
LDYAYDHKSTFPNAAVAAAVHDDISEILDLSMCRNRKLKFIKFFVTSERSMPLIRTASGKPTIEVEKNN